MMRPDPDTILQDADKLRTDRYRKRDDDLKKRAMERFNETKINVPPAYDKTANRHRSSIIEDEGRQIGTLVYAMPVPHLTSPEPEDETKIETQEKFAMALHKEMEARFGPIWWKCTLAQIHDNIGWVYFGWRKVPYKGAPTPPNGEDAVATADWMLKNNRYKKNAGVEAYVDYRYVTTPTAYCVGNEYDPDRFYEIKEVPERDLMQTYGIVRNRDGSYSKPAGDVNTTPPGYPEGIAGTEQMVKVVEYWDREWCIIVAETSATKFLGLRRANAAYVLAEWNHGWGRTPYFARPAHVTDQLAEDKKFTGPLDGIYTEMPEHKILRTMGHSVAYQTAFAPLQVITKDSGDAYLDDGGGKPLTFLELQPGKARIMPVGSQVAAVPQSPEIANLFHEIEASEQRIQRFSLSPTAKGVAPGADTANAALSNLHRFQLSTLDPLAEQASRQASAMYRFAFERIQEMPDRVYVFDEKTDSYLSLGKEDVVSVNVDAKVTPDQGQFQLLIEKHVMELYLSPKPIITLEQAYEMMGKENPHELALNVKAEKLADMLEPVVQHQIISDLGMLDAVNAMIQQNAQNPDQSAVPGLMNKVRQMNPSGAGKGSPGAPRTEGVRSPTVQETTQPAMESGMAPAATPMMSPQGEGP